MSLNPPVRNWQGRRVWLVGASSGIGAALAQELARRGARLALSARGAARLQALAAELPAALSLPLDVTDPAQWETASRALLREWGGVDMVVLNAGTYAPLRAWEISHEVVCDTLHTNLLGVTDGVAAVLPQMLRQGRGHIVIVASVAGYRGLPRALAYGPSKAALINFAECLYMDVADKGVAVSLVNPGFVATPLTARNDFHMPALISAQQAALEIVEGLARGAFEIHFPKRFSCLLKALRLLPAGLYFRLIRRATGL